MLAISHTGGPSRKFIDVTLPGTLGNDGLYAHGLGGPDTHKNIYADVVLTKKPGDNVLELRFRHLNVTSPTAGSSSGYLKDYFTSVIFEYNISATQNINFFIPQGAQLVPSYLTEYQDYLARPSQAKHFSAAALTIDAESFEGTGRFYHINVFNSGIILGAGGDIAQRRVWSYKAFVAPEEGFSSPNDHRPFFMPTQRPDGGGRRIVPSIDGGSVYGYNDMGYPAHDHGGMFKQYAGLEGNSQKLGSIGLPTDPIIIRGNLTHVLFRLYNKSTGEIKAGGGAGGGGPVEDIDISTSNNDAFNYVTEGAGQWSASIPYDQWETNGTFGGVVHNFASQYASSRAPYRPMIGGGFGGWGSGWHYHYGADYEYNTLNYYWNYERYNAGGGSPGLGIRLDGPFGHHRTSSTNKDNTTDTHTWDTSINGSAGFHLTFSYYPTFSWLSNYRGYEALAFEGGYDGNPYGILNKSGIPAVGAELLHVSSSSGAYLPGSNLYRIGWPDSRYVNGWGGNPFQSQTGPAESFAGAPGASPGSNFQKNAGSGGITTPNNLGGNGADYGQDGADATNLTYTYPTDRSVTFLRSGTGVGGKGGKSISVRWFTVGDSNGLTNQNAYVASAERLGAPYALIAENSGTIIGESDIQTYTLN